MKVDVAAGYETFPNFCLNSNFRGFYGILLPLTVKIFILFYKHTSKFKGENYVHWVYILFIYFFLN